MTQGLVSPGWREFVFGAVLIPSAVVAAWGLLAGGLAWFEATRGFGLLVLLFGAFAAAIVAMFLEVRFVRRLGPVSPLWAVTYLFVTALVFFGTLVLVLGVIPWALFNFTSFRGT